MRFFQFFVVFSECMNFKIDGLFLQLNQNVTSFFLLICAFCTSNCLIEEIYAFISLTWCKVYKYIGKNNLFFRKKRSGQIGSFWAVLKYLKFCWSILLLRVFFHVFMSKTSTNLEFLHVVKFTLKFDEHQNEDNFAF